MSEQHGVWSVSAAVIGALLAGVGGSGLGAVAGNQPGAVMVAMLVLAVMMFVGGVLLGMDVGWRLRGGAERRGEGPSTTGSDVDHSKETP